MNPSRVKRKEEVAKLLEVPQVVLRGELRSRETRSGGSGLAFYSGGYASRLRSLELPTALIMTDSLASLQMCSLLNYNQMPCKL